MNLVILRDTSGDEGVFGTMTLPDGTVLQTGEQPWRDNTPNISSIPNGKYQCWFDWSPHLQRWCYHIGPVPGRDGILFHSANLMGDREKGFKSELNGCIALGMSRWQSISREGKIQACIMQSRKAVALFETYMKGEDFDLEITTPTVAAA